MEWSEEYRKYLLMTHGITPESVYMGVNELRELIQIRSETISPILKKSLYPLTWEEWITYRESGIKRFLKQHTFYTEN